MALRPYCPGAFVFVVLLLPSCPSLLLPQVQDGAVASEGSAMRRAGGDRGDPREAAHLYGDR